MSVIVSAEKGETKKNEPVKEPEKKGQKTK